MCLHLCNTIYQPQLSFKSEHNPVDFSYLFLLHRGNTRPLCKYTILRLVCVESLHQNFNDIGLSVWVHTHSVHSRAMHVSIHRGCWLKAICCACCESGREVFSNGSRIHVKPFFSVNCQSWFFLIHSKNRRDNFKVKTLHVLYLFQNIFNYCCHKLEHNRNSYIKLAVMHECLTVHVRGIQHDITVSEYFSEKSLWNMETYYILHGSSWTVTVCPFFP